jgi:hypothetical protein
MVRKSHGIIILLILLFISFSSFGMTAVEKQEIADANEAAPLHITEALRTRVFI